MQQIPQELIIKALALTWRTIEDMTDPEFVHRTQWFPELYNWRLNWFLSIEKFCFYLLSPEFIEEFYYKADMSSEWKSKFVLPEDFWIAINFLQDWTSQPLIDLLKKI